MVGEVTGIEDDKSIADNCRFLRRVPPGWIQEGRPDSSNFEEKAVDTGLSVTAWIGQGDLDTVVSEARSFGVVCIDAAQLRAAGFAIVKRPLDENPNHCECFGAPSKGARRTLARNARWVRVPLDHDPEPYGELEQL